MRVFVAGASGVIGRQLVPLLLAAGHEVTGMTRSADRAAGLEQLGAQGVVCDVFDPARLSETLAAAAPEALVHELTSLPPRFDTRNMEATLAANDRIRVDGTRNLLDAAAAAGVRRIVAQSIAFSYEPGPPGTIHDEEDPLLERSAPAEFARSAAAVRELERMVREAGGVVLRYGYFYGPGSAISPEGSIGEDVRRRRMPIVGRGEGVWPLVHVHDAATATVAALERGRAGEAYNIVDDHPAPVSEWLPGLAAALGAPRPLRVPRLIARLVAGEYAVTTMTASQGASNSRARRELGWTPRYPTWREGFQALG
jgi:nucleoside-diphosphate-sugar epimerase